MASSGRRRVLLIGSSNVYGTGYLDHAETEIVRALADVSRVFFVPHALFDVRAAVRNAEAVFIGGGNTFRLLSALYELDLLEPIRHRVAEGMPYVGSSAGAIVAGPSLGTTKDMPIVEPPSFDALALVPFQLSPHYLDPDPTSTHMGETQEERIGQFLEEHDRTVVGLREGAILRVDGDGVTLTGVAGARIFRRGAPPLEASPPCRLD